MPAFNPGALFSSLTTTGNADTCSAFDPSSLISPLSDKVGQVGDLDVDLLADVEALERRRRCQERHFKTVVAVQRDDRLSGRDLRERLDLDAGDGAGERREQLAAIEVVIGQFELTTRLIELRPGA